MEGTKRVQEDYKKRRNSDVGQCVIMKQNEFI